MRAWDFIPEKIIPKRIKAWRDKNERRRKSLAIAGRNTNRLRKRIRTAFETKRFFAFLCAAKPMLPIEFFLPFLAVRPALSAWGETAVGNWECVLKLLTIFITSGVVAMRIYEFKIRHRMHLLRNRKSIQRRRAAQKAETTPKNPNIHA